jgi:acetyl esterase/lipase
MERWFEAGRTLAWLTLLVVAAYYVHGETFRTTPPEGVLAYTDVVYRQVGDRVERLDVYRPAAAGTHPAIVAIHGGGWRGGTKNSYGRGVARLARHGFVVISVDYVLSRPGHPSWPGNLEDVRESVRWTRRHASEYAIDPSRIAALGASAGGHLAALLGTNAGGDDPEARVQAAVDLYGPTDLAALYIVPKAVESLDLYIGKPLGDGPEAYAAASPIRHVSPNSAPMLLIHGSIDPLVPLGQSTELGRRLEACGVPVRVVVVPGAGHSFGLRVEGLDLVPEIVGFLEGVWGPSPTASLTPTRATASRDASPRGG